MITATATQAPWITTTEICRTFGSLPIEVRAAIDHLEAADEITVYRNSRRERMVMRECLPKIRAELVRRGCLSDGPRGGAA